MDLRESNINEYFKYLITNKLGDILKKEYKTQYDRNLIFDNDLVEFYKSECNNNNVFAIHYLGVMYMRGSGIDQDYNKAIELFEQGCNLNYSASFNKLGHMYVNGLGVDRDYNKAIKLFEQNCNLNYHSPASFNYLGRMYLGGLGVDQDYNKAIELSKQGCNLNSPGSFANLGFIYFNGLGVDKDYNKAIELFEQGLLISYNKIYMDQFILVCNGRLSKCSKLIKIINIYLKHKKYKLVKPLIDECLSLINIDSELSELILNLNLELIYGSEIPWILKMLQNLYKTKIDLLQLHFEYTENGIGFEKAKKDFINNINLH